MQVAALAAGIARLTRGTRRVAGGVAIQAVVRQEVGVDDAAVGAAQEADLETEGRAGVGVIGGRGGGVVVGRYVPVTGRGKHAAAAARSADDREQEAALARIVERK